MKIIQFNVFFSRSYGCANKKENLERKIKIDSSTQFWYIILGVEMLIKKSYFCTFSIGVVIFNLVWCRLEVFFIALFHIIFWLIKKSKLLSNDRIKEKVIFGLIFFFKDNISKNNHLLFEKIIVIICLAIVFVAYK